MEKPYTIKTITDLHKIAGVTPPQHPLFSIIRVEDIPDLPDGYPTNFIYEFYSIGLKRNLKGYIEYGRKKYDFQEGLIGFVAPNQVLSYANSDASEATGWMLFFHNELLARSALASKITYFGFFNYAVNEALHLSTQEEQAIENLFENMYLEYSQRIDQFSKDVIISNLELLFTYSKRFYSRQFLTRHEVDSAFLDKFYDELNRYFWSDELVEQGLPSASLFAEKLHLSTNYLSDLLKAITGKTTREHIHFKIVEMAKEKLLGTDMSVSQIAYSLGFEYPQYFNRLFKDKTGHTPREFRLKDY